MTRLDEYAGTKGPVNEAKDALAEMEKSTGTGVVVGTVIVGAVLGAALNIPNVRFDPLLCVWGVLCTTAIVALKQLCWIARK